MQLQHGQHQPLGQQALLLQHSVSPEALLPLQLSREAVPALEQQQQQHVVQALQSWSSMATTAEAAAPELQLEDTHLSAAAEIPAAAAVAGDDNVTATSNDEWDTLLDTLLTDPAERPTLAQPQLPACNQQHAALAGEEASEQQHHPSADAAAAEDADDSSSDIELNLLETCRQRDANVSPTQRELQDWNDAAAVLEFKVLELFAGCHGNSTAAALPEIMQRVMHHNLIVAQIHNARRVQLQELKEGWFLQRNPLHLAVSKVSVWGMNAAPLLEGELPGEQRRLLLQVLLQTAASTSSSSSSSSSRRQLLEATNRNEASPFFTACHFSIPEALQQLLNLPELGWKQMLQFTKRGAGAACA
jgi:hypothetical protein